MQRSISRSSRFMPRPNALAICLSVGFNGLLFPQSVDNSRDDLILTSRTYIIGTTPDVKRLVKSASKGHHVTLSNRSSEVEYGAPPQACGIQLHKTFVDYCVVRYHLAMTPCEVSNERVRCSTDYLEPRDEKVYWRLRYDRQSQQSSLELQTLQRTTTGRVQEVTNKNAKIFEELFELMLRTSRCENP